MPRIYVNQYKRKIKGISDLPYFYEDLPKGHMTPETVNDYSLSPDVYEEEREKRWVELAETYDQMDHKYSFDTLTTATTALHQISRSNQVTMTNLRGRSLWNKPVSIRKAAMKVLIKEKLIEPFDISDEYAQIHITEKGKKLTESWKSYDYTRNFKTNPIQRPY